MKKSIAITVISILTVAVIALGVLYYLNDKGKTETINNLSAEISEKTKMSQSAVSHQLRILKQARLIKARRDGKNTFYSLDDEHVKRIVEQVMIHITE